MKSLKKGACVLTDWWYF